MPLFNVLPVDKKFYKENLEDFLPDRIFDVHTHIYRKTNDSGDPSDKIVAWPSRVADCNPIEDFEETAALMFPGKKYMPLMFGMAEKKDDLADANAYVSSVCRDRGYPALLFTGPDTGSGKLEADIINGGFKGIKVYLTLAPDHIPVNEIRIFDFLTHEHLELMDRHGWTVMLHIPRPARLRDPLNLAQLLEIEARYKNLRLIVAHVGRAYCNSDAGGAFETLKSTERMLFDISANTNSRIFERLIRMAGPGRILFGSDLPITRMRMRRVEKDGIYVNLVPRGLYGDVSADRNMGELDPPESEGLTFFLYEEMEAFRQAAIRTKLSRKDIERVFWNNAANLFDYTV
jgi:predicted TIM-barrel fold metal-dependent hydrolase